MHGGASAGAKYTRHVLIGLKQPNGMLLKIGTFAAVPNPAPGTPRGQAAASSLFPELRLLHRR